MIHEKNHFLNEISSDSHITKIIISDDEVMTVNPNSSWKVERIYTDYAPRNEHKELIVVFKKKEVEG